MHLIHELLLAFRQGRVDEPTLIEYLVSHCLDLCPHCAAEFASFESIQHVGDGGGASTRVCSHGNQLPEVPSAPALSPSIRGPHGESERLDAQLLELCAEPTEHWPKLLGHYGSPAFAHRLLDAAQAIVSQNPAGAVRLAAAALEVSHKLPQPLPELEALACAVQGNGRRILSDFEGATQAFETLRTALLGAVTDPSVLGEIHSLWASLRIDLRSFDSAHYHLRRATLFFELTQDTAGLCRVQINRSNAFYHQRKPLRAIEVLEECMDSLRRGSPKLRIVALNTLALSYIDLGNDRAAAAVLQEVEALFDPSAHRFATLKIHWTQARLHLLCRELEPADGLLQALRATYLDEGRPYLVALVDIDRARVALARGNLEEGIETLEGTLPTLSQYNFGGDYETCLRQLETGLLEESLTLPLLAGSLRVLESYGGRARPAR